LPHLLEALREVVLQQFRELFGIRRPVLELDACATSSALSRRSAQAAGARLRVRACVDVLAVLAEDDHVDRARIFHRRGHACAPPHALSHCETLDGNGWLH
jgi:hypothetical protein